MTRFILLLCLFTLQLSLVWANSCLKITEPTKIASQKILGANFPYWYNVALAQQESNCKWITSIDGWGSIGYFQITPQFEGWLIDSLFPDWRKPYSEDSFLAFAYVLKTLIHSTPEHKLWMTYQRYNGGNWVVRECKSAGSYQWRSCYEYCNSHIGQPHHRGHVCVWRKHGRCMQYRSACDINYLYSLHIFEWGQKYKPMSAVEYISFW